MDEVSRIRALREQGRIDDAQAERLLAALGRTDGAAEHADSPEASAAPPASETPGASRADAQPVLREAAAAAPGEAAWREAAEGTGETSTWTGGTRTGAAESGATAESATGGTQRRWARIQMFAGALEVGVDPDLDAPQATSDEGTFEVTSDGDGWRIEQPARNGDGWIERLMDGMKRTRVRVRIPVGVGVDLDVKAGDVRLRDVPALRGRLMAGDLDAEGLRAVDVSLNAGDLDLRLDPEPGRHRVRMTAGDAEIRLPSGADVTVTGRVSVGDASAPPPFETRRSGIADRLSGTLGEGRARLEIELTTGDLELRTD